jgi:ribosomal protein S14
VRRTRAKARAVAKCQPKIAVVKGGARSCSTCGAKAATSKTIMLCARTGRLPK